MSSVSTHLPPLTLQACHGLLRKGLVRADSFGALNTGGDRLLGSRQVGYAIHSSQSPKWVTRVLLNGRSLFNNSDLAVTSQDLGSSECASEHDPPSIQAVWKMTFPVKTEPLSGLGPDT